LAEAAAAGSSRTLIARTGTGFRQTEAETGAEIGTEEGTGTGAETGIGTGSASSSRIDTGTEEVTWAGMTGVAAVMTGTERSSRTTAEGVVRTGEVTGAGADAQSSSRIVAVITHGSGSSSNITGVAEVAGVHSSSGERRSRRANPSGESQVGAAGLIG
jgi:hypothetical protein